MNTQLVVFDMAGTTVNDGKTVYKSVQSALEKFGYNFELQDVMNKIGGMNKLVGISDLIEEKLGKKSESQAEKVHDEFLNQVNNAYETDPDLKEIEGTTKVFEFLKENGIAIALDTGYHRKTADILIERMGWKEQNFIDISVTSDEVPEGRPTPFMIQKAMNATGVSDTSKIIKVGDTTSDILEGRNSNCGLVVAIYSGTQSEEELKNLNPDHLIYKLPEIIDLIK